MCSAEDWCSECFHLSLLHFQAYVKDAEKRSAKEKKQAKSFGGSSEKRSHRQELASEPWASSAAPELVVGGVNLHAAPRYAPPPVTSGVPSPTVPGPSMEFSGLGGVSVCAAPLPSLALGVRGVQSHAVSGSSVDFSGFRGVSLSAAPLPSVAPAVSVAQTPTVSGASREFSGLSGMSLRAAPLPGVAPGLSGLQTPADRVSSVAGPGVGGLSLRAAPLSGKASGACEEPAPARPVSSLGLVGGGETGLHAAPLPAGLPGDGNFAGSAGVSSMGMPHVDWLHGSMPSQVLPRAVDAGADPGGAVVSQAAATGWPSFSEEMFHRGRLALQMRKVWPPFTGVERTSGTSRLGPTPLVLPRSPLALEVCREQLGCSLGISNPASAKFVLPRRLAVVEQRELESLQRSLVSQIACGLASTAQGVRAKAGRAVCSRCLALVVPPSVPPPPAPKMSCSFHSRGIFRGCSRGLQGSR
ncbi:hypothetical protein E2C01_042585 [Portunus trituberculatus]|uniref:Uncharacterized protein n=1 Tax=Portunus trituberculatus TaxID=210409 RepID=A0A5B7FQL9_PORTR|nr:hypothetical protein [Portunus trituberculatus]